MQDLFGRSITYLRLSVTELCNLRCQYCMPAEGICKKRHEEMLTEEEMILAVTAAAQLGVTKVRITGGEPLVKRNILSICEKAAAVPGIRELCMTSNGLRMPELAPSLRAAGVRRVNISLDTLNPERYRFITRIGSLEDALRGIEAALAAGFERVKINTVLIGGFNDTEIRPLAELTQRYPLDVRFIELMPMMDRCVFGPEAFVPCDLVLRALPELRMEGEDGVARVGRLPHAQGRVGLISPLSAHFCAMCNRLRLTADGKIKPCLHAPLEYSVRGQKLEEMRETFMRAAAAKPERHGCLSYDARSQASRPMNQIGG